MCKASSPLLHGPTDLRRSAAPAPLPPLPADARWTEAHSAWRRLTYASRDLTRQAVTYLHARPGLGPGTQAGGAAPCALLDLVCRWIPAYARVLMCHVRDDCSLEAELSKILLPGEVAAVLAAQHRPSYVLQVSAGRARQGGAREAGWAWGRRAAGRCRAASRLAGLRARSVCAPCPPARRVPLRSSAKRCGWRAWRRCPGTSGSAWTSTWLNWR